MWVVACAAGTLGFLAYAQFAPTMGNVWYRCGHFSPGSAVNLMLHPFTEPMLWHPKMWIINYPIWLTAAALSGQTLAYWLQSSAADTAEPRGK